MKKIIATSLLSILINFAFAQYNYLGSYTSDGTPLYLTTNDVVTTQTLSLIQNALPEGKPVPIYNPQYIYSGYSTDIRLQDSAEVWVTFVDEGAGYKNVLGFYTYDLNNPITSVPTTNNITIIFPNVSKVGSGGGLVAGNKVKIGNFSPNTGIGFMLIADGWRNGAVSNGNWKLYSNADFNPEANSAKRQHNALIADTANQRIILGFEDIRRDYSNCDNDFNDALFYITASPYSAIMTENYVSIDSSSTDVSSSNDGGLESNGRLADRIAKRMFTRQKNNENKFSTLEFQHKFNNVILDGINGSLKDYLPTTGLYGTESAYVSTPVDLLSITNATDVFAVDYYNNNQRVNAALITHTQNKVYDHSKYICDRLNGATLTDVRTIELNGYKIINTTFKRDNGETEYALTFSALVTDSSYTLYSLWNIDQYPAGEYLNYQIWGNSIAQICNTANAIIAKLQQEKNVETTSNLTKTPSVFIKKGVYKNGKFYLTVANKSKVNKINISSNYRRTETETFNNYNTVINLTGKSEEEVEVNMGNIFDAGITIFYNGCTQNDALYLADGAWGVDYDNTLSKNIEFKSSTPSINNLDNTTLNIERDVEVKGSTKGTLNVFRNAKSGNSFLNISKYKNISFEMESNKDIEVIIVEKGLTSWEKRKLYFIKANNAKKSYSIELNLFKDKDGNVLNLDSIKSVVFSVQGDYVNYANFNLAVKNTNFNNTEFINLVATKTAAYPNPCINKTTLTFDTENTDGILSIIDASGKTIFSNKITLNNKSYKLDVSTFQKGIYLFNLKNQESITTGKFIVQ
ncbi:MAG: DUF4114 domain-containing protein [Chitinophagaceae bacterium]